MRRWFLVILCALACSCSRKDDPHKLRVAASTIPHAQMLAFVEEELKEEGIVLDVFAIDDYNIPNRALAEKDVDANFFQHQPFLNEQVKQFGYKIICLARIHLEPMALYSNKVTSLRDLKEGATIAVPNDPSNEYRALALLEKEGLIQLDPSVHLQATVRDIRSNPRNLRFREVDAALLSRTLKEVEIAAIPTNFALEAKLNPTKDALAIESKDSPYANIIAIREGDRDKPKIQALKRAMLSPKMATFIKQEYQGAVIPVLKECKSEMR